MEAFKLKAAPKDRSAYNAGLPLAMFFYRGFVPVLSVFVRLVIPNPEDIVNGGA